MSDPTTAPGVETKVKVATVGSYFGGLVGFGLVDLLSNGAILGLLPEPWTILLAPLLPAIIAFLTGYLSKHTPRGSGFGVDVDAVIEAKVAEGIERAKTELGKHQADKSLPPLGGDRL